MGTNAWGNIKTDEVELELPDLDGEDEVEAELAPDTLPMLADDPNALDDATGEDSPVEELDVEGTEGGWLVDAENAGTLDVGPFDVSISAEGRLLDDVEADPRGSLEDLVDADEVFVADAGEEGPLAEDEELREEDLPALDADDDGDVPDDALFERALLVADDDLRWDDRAWARAETAGPLDDADDSGVLAVPSDDPTHPRDATWKRLEQGGHVMAAGFVPGGSVVLALASPDRNRAMLVRIQPDGEARIIAEVDPSTRPGFDDDTSTCAVHFVRWSMDHGSLYVGGTFGLEAYRPA